MEGNDESVFYHPLNKEEKDTLSDFQKEYREALRSRFIPIDEAVKEAASRIFWKWRKSDESLYEFIGRINQLKIRSFLRSRKAVMAPKRTGRDDPRIDPATDGYMPLSREEREEW